MKRGLTLILATLLVVLAVSLSFLNAPIVASQDDRAEALKKLRELHDEVSDPSLLPSDAFKNPQSADGHRRALTNKINVVIHQVEAGAINGAINKLENDLINTITDWVTEEYAGDLIDKITYIIDLLRGIQPPPPLPPRADFDMAAFPDSLTIQRGGSGESIIMVISLKGFRGTVDLRVVLAPAGVTFRLDPTQVELPPNEYKTSTLTIAVGTSAPTGFHTVRVNGTSGALEHHADISLEITALPPPPQPKIDITSVLRVPETPNYDEDVTVITQVKSELSPIDKVILSYSFNAIDWVNSTMSLVEALYSTVIPHKPYQTTVSYKVYANNIAGQTDVSEAYSYVVVDSRAPTISGIERSIVSPNYNDTVTVAASVTEPADASGVKPERVLLVLTAGSVQTNVTMTLEGGKYRVVIGELPFGTLVKYRILTSDKAGNWAVSDEASYTVGDEYPPRIRIDSPAPGSYLKGSVDVVVFAVDDNFEKAELTINAVSVTNWTSGGEHTFLWNTDTVTYPDGTYLVKLRARDKAENLVEESLSVTVDNTLPTAAINTPSHGGFLRLDVLVNVTGRDANFDRMELRIDATTVKTWTTAGSQTYEWKTKGFYTDGAYTVSLTVYDKAGNSRQVQVSVTVDNTAPTIEVPSWTPRTPSAQENVSVTVKITDNPMGSGVKNAILWYRNGTVKDWRPVLMISMGGNWTATIPGQGGDSKVEFYIEASDNAGNVEKGEVYDFTATMPPAFPLWLLALIVLIILAAIGAAIYWVRYGARRRVKRADGEVVPSTRVLAAWLWKRRDHPTVSFIVPAHNQESRIASCISNLFQCAGEYPAPSEIIVVDDGSSDLTYEAACETVKMNRRRWPHVKGRVIRHTANLGRAEAVHTGVTAATRELVCVFDPTRGWSQPY